MLERMPYIEAEEQFWAITELVKYLLPYLDAYSISSLACVHKLTIKILQSSSILSGIVKKSGLPFDLLNEETLEQQRIGIRRLVQLLLKMENKKPLLLDLLHCICERCPIAGNSRRGVKVSCFIPGHETHFVSPFGFVLLEEAEGAFSSTEQGVKEIVMHNLKGPFLTALGSRLLRQEMKIRVEAQEVECRDISHARSFHTLMQKCQFFLPYSVKVRVLGRIGAEGWFQLAEAFKQFGVDSGFVIRTLQHVLQEARLEDLRSIWDLSLGSSWHVISRRTGPILIVKEEGRLVTEEEREDNWAKLEKLWMPSQDE